MTAIDEQSVLGCPVPISSYREITMAHGGGGRVMRRLIKDVFSEAFGDTSSAPLHDGATLHASGDRLAFTTDSYVVHPLSFPGGTIGSLAVNGTVNDLAMCGARPLALSAGFLLEEGLSLDTLRSIARSMRAAADEAGVSIVTGDTKVVDRGKGDGIFINTAGIGVLEHDLSISPLGVRPGDALILSGDIGRHGIAIMSAREGLEFETTIESDCAPLTEPILALLDAGLPTHCFRDLTRGGLASAAVEIAEDAGVRIDLDEASIAVQPQVAAACELLGLDPLYVANEGRFICILPAAEAERALSVLRAFAVTAGASIAGMVRETAEAGIVVLRSRIGANRLVDMLSGEQLPRIC